MEKGRTHVETMAGTCNVTIGIIVADRIIDSRDFAFLTPNFEPP